MPFKEADMGQVYKADSSLKPQDVQSLLEWAAKQPHLPKITELQAALFLQSCYYSNEMAKTTIDNYFTVKTICADLFGNRNPDDPEIQTAINTMLITMLPKETPEGYSVIFIRILNTDPDLYNYPIQVRAFDMLTLLKLHQEGPKKGMIILIDMKGIVFGHLLKISMVVVKKLMYYLQEAMPIRLKSLEFCNVVPFMDKIMALMRPFLKSELMESLYLHTTMDTVYKRIPQDILPQDYGGSCESMDILMEKYRALFHDNKDFFKFEDSQVVDESKRPGKPRNINDIFGVDGTFKKLEVD